MGFERRNQRAGAGHATHSATRSFPIERRNLARSWADRRVSRASLTQYQTSARLTFGSALLLTFAGVSVGDGLGGVAVVAFAAVVAVAAGGEVSAPETHPAGHPAGQLPQLHVEAALAGVAVAVARWNTTDANIRTSVTDKSLTNHCQPRSPLR